MSNRAQKSSKPIPPAITDEAMIDHCAMLCLADLIETNSCLSWSHSKVLARKIVDEIAGCPELFS